jgi:1-acyl-sn-glycerol-3-phosphate acyltransferase
VIAATHGSYPDFLWIGMAASERGRWVRFMTRHDVWNSRARRPMTGMRHIPVDREAPAAAYLTARRLLREGEAVGMFPEAGISYAYAVRSLMPGAAALARDTGAPVVPLALWGTQRIWSVDRHAPGKVARPSLTRHRRVDLAFGPALTVAPGEDLTEATIRLGHSMTDLLEGLQRLPEHVPAPGEHAPWYPAHLGGHAPDRAEALSLDSVPKSAVPPSWGPPIVSA